MSVYFKVRNVYHQGTKDVSLFVDGTQHDLGFMDTNQLKELVASLEDAIYDLKQD